MGRLIGWVSHRMRWMAATTATHRLGDWLEVDDSFGHLGGRSFGGRHDLRGQGGLGRRLGGLGRRLGHLHSLGNPARRPFRRDGGHQRTTSENQTGSSYDSVKQILLPRHIFVTILTL